MRRQYTPCARPPLVLRHGLKAEAWAPFVKVVAARHHTVWLPSPHAARRGAHGLTAEAKGGRPAGVVAQARCVWCPPGGDLKTLECACDRACHQKHCRPAVEDGRERPSVVAQESCMVAPVVRGEYATASMNAPQVCNKGCKEPPSAVAKGVRGGAGC